MINVASVKNPTCYNHRNFPGKLFLILFFTGNNISDFLIKIQLCPIVQLLPGKAQMSPGLRSFNDDQICCAVITVCPHFQDQLCCTFR